VTILFTPTRMPIELKRTRGLTCGKCLGGGGEEAFYRSFLQNFGGGYLISPIFYENEL
jgi:hypothetical protein